MVHRNIYATWISKVTGPGKTELHLDWKSIWRNTAALKNTKIKETMFLFNQRLLPTRARDYRIDSTTDPTCCFCNQEPKSDEHIMLHCPSREISTLWLERTLRSHGCSTIPGFHQRTTWACSESKNLLRARGCLHLRNVEGETRRKNTVYH
jgi:hypothetical protein